MLLAANADDPAGRADPSSDERRAVERLFSKGLAGGQIVDVFEIAGERRPEISVLSDEFLDDIGGRLARPAWQVALLRKPLAGEIPSQMRGNPSTSASVTSCCAGTGR